MKHEFFGMRRANGDWFAMEVDRQWKVLIFPSMMSAWRARAKNPELTLFWPTSIDEPALAEFASADDGRPVSFWLHDEEDPDADLRRGHPLEYMQLVTAERLTDLPLKFKRERAVSKPTATKSASWFGWLRRPQRE